MPNGRQLVSRHGSGEDVVFLPRDKVAAGDYVVTGQLAGLARVSAGSTAR